MFPRRRRLTLRSCFREGALRIFLAARAAGPPRLASQGSVTNGGQEGFPVGHALSCPRDLDHNVPGRALWFSSERHIRLFRIPVPLSLIALSATGHEILPRCGSAA
ncbi:MAG: hypothetical protein ACI9KE_006697 [Polyangiales bacterium]|jgi:hypothetical protein